MGNYVGQVVIHVGALVDIVVVMVVTVMVVRAAIRVVNGEVEVHMGVHVVKELVVLGGTRSRSIITTTIVVLHPWFWGQLRVSRATSVGSQGTSSETVLNCSRVVEVGSLVDHHVDVLGVV